MDIDLILEMLKNNRALWVTATVVGGFSVVISVLNAIWLYIQNKKQHSFDKQLEKYKAGIENKTYISKTRFDTEFSIYRTLSVTFFDMVKCVNIMIPSGISQVPADKEEKKKFDKTNYSNTVSAVVKAQDKINGNAPFITEELYQDYSNILILCREQLNVFIQRCNVLYLAPQEEKEKLTVEDYKRTVTINESMTALNNKIRKYISSLDVID